MTNNNMKLNLNLTDTDAVECFDLGAFKLKMIEALNNGAIDEEFVGTILDNLKRKREIDERIEALHEKQRQEDLKNEDRLDMLVGTINKFSEIGVPVIRSQKIHGFSIERSPENFAIQLNDEVEKPHWRSKSLVIPTTYLTVIYDQAKTKYGIPLLKDIVKVLNTYPFWTEDIERSTVSERGSRLVATLKKRGWNPVMAQWEYDTWKSNLPGNIIPVIIRAIMSGQTGHMQCLGCKYAQFKESGYVVCRKRLIWVYINGGMPEYVKEATNKRIIGTDVFTNVVVDITAECSCRKKVSDEKEMRLRQAIYEKHSK